MSGYAEVPVRECSVCHLRTICKNIDAEVMCSGCEVVVKVVAYMMEQVEAFRDLCMTETTVEQRFSLMGEVIGSILEYLLDHPENLRRMLWKADALTKETP